MDFRQIVIPITTGHIVLMFKQYQKNGDWVSIASDEAMEDITVLLGAQSGNE